MRDGLKKLAELKEAANTASNAVNRQKTVIKHEVHAYLNDAGASNNDGVIVDGFEIAYRPNVTDEISPREWYDWWQKKKISDNQFFSAISVSITTARNAIGNDQLDQVKHETLSKTADLRIIEAKDAVDGKVVPFAGAAVKPAVVARQKVTNNSGKPVETIRTKKVRKIRL